MRDLFKTHSNNSDIITSLSPNPPPLPGRNPAHTAKVKVPIRPPRSPILPSISPSVSFQPLPNLLPLNELSNGSVSPEIDLNKIDVKPVMIIPVSTTILTENSGFVFTETEKNSTDLLNSESAASFIEICNSTGTSNQFVSQNSLPVITARQDSIHKKNSRLLLRASTYPSPITIMTSSNSHHQEITSPNSSSSSYQHDFRSEKGSMSSTNTSTSLPPIEKLGMIHEPFLLPASSAEGYKIFQLYQSSDDTKMTMISGCEMQNNSYLPNSLPVANDLGSDNKDLTISELVSINLLSTNQESLEITQTKSVSNLEPRNISYPITPTTPVLPERSKMRESRIASNAFITKTKKNGSNTPRARMTMTFLNKELPSLPENGLQSRGRASADNQGLSNPDSCHEWECINANLHRINSNINKWEEIENDIHVLLKPPQFKDPKELYTLAKAHRRSKFTHLVSEMENTQPLQFNPSPNPVSLENIDLSTPPVKYQRFTSLISRSNTTQVGKRSQKFKISQSYLNLKNTKLLGNLNEKSRPLLSPRRSISDPSILQIRDEVNSDYLKPVTVIEAASSPAISLPKQAEKMKNPSLSFVPFHPPGSRPRFFSTSAAVPAQSREKEIQKLAKSKSSEELPTEEAIPMKHPTTAAVKFQPQETINSVLNNEVDNLSSSASSDQSVKPKVGTWTRKLAKNSINLLRHMNH